MKRALAYLAYAAGAILMLKSVVDGFTGDNPVDWLLGVCGVAWWWIGAGIGIRLGVMPREFLSALRALVGLGRDSGSVLDTPSRGAEDPTP